MPTVSVVIPVYNRAHLIGRALRSVLCQTIDDFEVIVVDDGSTDDLSSVVKSFADPRVRLVRHSERMDGSAARNTGIEHSKSELVAFLDSDDEWVNDKLAKQIEALNRADGIGRSLVIGNTARRDWEAVSKNDGNNWVPRSGQEIRLDLLGVAGAGVKVNWCTMLAPRRELLRIGGFDPALPATEWWDLIYRLTDRCDFLLGTEQLLIAYDPHGDRRRQRAKIGRAAEVLLAKYDMMTPEAKAMRSRLLTFSAMYRMAQGEYLNPLRSLTAAFLSGPGLRPAARVAGALFGGHAYSMARRALGRRSTGARYD